MSKLGIWGWPEEATPSGSAGTLRLLTGDDKRRINSPVHIVAARVQSHPWFLIMWEQLTHGNVPGPELTRIWCCYSRTVVFYKRPWIVAEDKYSFQQWAQVDGTLRIDDVVEFDGELFDVGLGQVRWNDGNWWICRWARQRNT